METEDINDMLMQVKVNSLSCCSKNRIMKKL